MAVVKIIAFLNTTQDLGITYERGSRLSLAIFDLIYKEGFCSERRVSFSRSGDYL